MSKFSQVALYNIILLLLMCFLIYIHEYLGAVVPILFMSSYEGE